MEATPTRRPDPILRRVGLVAFAVAAVAVFLLAPDSGRFERVALLVLIGVLAVVWHLVLAPTVGSLAQARVGAPASTEVSAQTPAQVPASAQVPAAASATPTPAPSATPALSADGVAVADALQVDAAASAGPARPGDPALGEVIDLRSTGPVRGGSGSASGRPSGYFDLGGDDRPEPAPPPSVAPAPPPPAPPPPTPTATPVSPPLPPVAPAAPPPSPAPAVSPGPVPAAAASSSQPIALPAISTTAVVTHPQARVESAPAEPVPVAPARAEPAAAHRPDEPVVAASSGAHVGVGGDDPWLMWASKMFDEPVGGR